jgi:hypothetical protein
VLYHGMLALSMLTSSLPLHSSQQTDVAPGQWHLASPCPTGVSKQTMAWYLFGVFTG